MTKPILQALVLADNIYQDKETGKMIIAGTYTHLWSVKRPEATPVDEAVSEIVEDNDLSDREGPENQQQIPMRFVGKAGSPSLYVCLTDIHKSVKLELRVVDLSNDDVLLKGDLNVQCDDPLRPAELNLKLPLIPYPHEGTYAYEILYENELLGSWRVGFAYKSIDELTDGE